jgi:hypothetical protein
MKPHRLKRLLLSYLAIRHLLEICLRQRQPAGRRGDVPPLMSKETRELLTHEFDQAWAHYRHVETLRTSYLASIFTVSLAALPIISAISNVNGVSYAGRLILIELALSLIALLCWFVSASFRRFDRVLWHYERTWNLIRAQFYSGSEKQLWSPLDIREDPRIASARIQRASTLAYFVPTFFLTLCTVGQLAVAVRLCSLQSAIWQVTLAALSTIASGIAVVAALLNATRR